MSIGVYIWVGILGSSRKRSRFDCSSIWHRPCDPVSRLRSAVFVRYLHSFCRCYECIPLDLCCIPRMGHFLYMVQSSFRVNLCTQFSSHIFTNLSGVYRNIVSTVNLDCTLDLRQIAMQARNAEFNPKRFAAVIMRIRYCLPGITKLVPDLTCHYSHHNAMYE